MNIFNHFSKSYSLRSVLASVCIIFLLLVSSVSAGRGSFGNNPHNSGFNPRCDFGPGGMNFNQGNLRMGAQHNFGFHQSSGQGNSPVSVIPVGGNYGGNGGSAGGSGPVCSGGGVQPTTGTSNTGSGGFSGSLLNNGCMSNGPSNNTSGGNSGIGCEHNFVGGYSGNGFIMTKCGSDVVIRMPFNNDGKQTDGKGGVAFGCGDAFSEVFSGSDCNPAISGVPNPIGAKGPNPHHGGQHSKKGFGNPGGGKCNGHWGEGNRGKGKGNIWTGNRGRGVGEGMCGKCCHHDDDNDADADTDTDFDTDFDCDNDIDTDFDNDTDLDLDNDTDDDVVLAPAAPLWNEKRVEFAGCPALMNWTAAELGLPKEQLQIYIVNPRTAFRDINPCDMCARLQRAALVLNDSQDIYLPALTEVLDEIASPGTPLSPEQMMVIAQRLAEPEPGSVYERAAEYINAARTYVTILRDEMGYTADGSFTLAAKYIGTIDNPDVADYVTAQLINLGL